MIPVPANGRVELVEPRSARPRRIAARECEEHGLSDMPTLGEYRAEIQKAYKRDRPARAHLLTRLAIRAFERKQAENRRRTA